MRAELIKWSQVAIPIVELFGVKIWITMSNKLTGYCIELADKTSNYTMTTLPQYDPSIWLISEIMINWQEYDVKREIFLVWNIVNRIVIV